MAYDKIIPVTSRLDHCVAYIENPEKTDLSAELEYITNEGKTIGVLVDGINCDAETAYAEMTATKQRWSKCRIPPNSFLCTRRGHARTGPRHRSGICPPLAGRTV